MIAPAKDFGPNDIPESVHAVATGNSAAVFSYSATMQPDKMAVLLVAWRVNGDRFGLNRVARGRVKPTGRWFS